MIAYNRSRFPWRGELSSCILRDVRNDLRATDHQKVLAGYRSITTKRKLLKRTGNLYEEAEYLHFFRPSTPVFFVGPSSPSSPVQSHPEPEGKDKPLYDRHVHVNVVCQKWPFKGLWCFQSSTSLVYFFVRLVSWLGQQCCVWLFPVQLYV